MVEKVDSCHFSATRELAVVVLHINHSLQLKLLRDTLLGLGATLRMDFGMSKETRLNLNSVIIDQANSINLANDKLVSLIVDLHSCDIVMSLLPVNDFSLLDIPNANHLVKASRCDIIFRAWFYK